MKKTALFLTLLLLLGLVGCSSPADPSSSEIPFSSIIMPSSISEIEGTEVVDEVKYDNGEGTVAMTSRIVREVLGAPVVPASSRDVINARIATEAANARANADEMSKEAIAESETDNFAVYTFNEEITVAYAGAKTVQFLITNETYSGGMHSLIGRSTLAFSSETGEELTLDRIFDVDSSVYLPRLYTEVERQIETGATEEPHEFYPNYSEALRGVSLQNKWHFSESGLVLLFSPYDIAPYSEGNITFTIAYDKLVDILESSLIDEKA